MEDYTKDCVSIIFVHYSQDTLRRSLAYRSFKSLLETIHTPCEIIVVDNGNNIEDSKFFLNQCHEKKITHYVRNTDNLHFGYARNQVMDWVVGKYTVIADNDIEYKDGWLEKCIRLLETFPEKKLIATPLTAIRVGKWSEGKLEFEGETFLLNPRAGSNCMVMPTKAMKLFGKFGFSPKAGCYYANVISRNGYCVAYPLKGNEMAIDIGFKTSGAYWLKELDIKKTLSDGSSFLLQRYGRKN